MALTHTDSPRYHRYHIETRNAPDILPWPSRFNVRVDRPKLAALLLKELIHYRGDLDVVLSRPCVYGVFSGPVGGFAPRERLCVGCLRCTTQYPDMVEISHNPERKELGDTYFTSSYVNAVAYEAEGGRIPVKGAGYRGRFGGEGWDGMWTDMSEIVRPTRDGIHGREFISTSVDIGIKASHLRFDGNGKPLSPPPRIFSLPLPTLFDVPPDSVLDEDVCRIFDAAARKLESLVFLPVPEVLAYSLVGPHLVPLALPADQNRLVGLPFQPRMIALDGWDAGLFHWLSARFPESLLCLRTPFQGAEALLGHYQAGVRIFHLTANYHGRGIDGRFLHELIRDAHRAFVEAGIRDEVTLLGGGGIIAAEHVPKAIIAGLDAVALDTAPLVALQAHFEDQTEDRREGDFLLPDYLPHDWGVQRLMNMVAAWRDQLLEVLGAMGLREVRRLRGETGRVMYQKDLELEAFAGIEGYHV